MADQKSRTVVFKTPCNFSLTQVRDAIQEQAGPGTIEVVQELALGEYLVQLTSEFLAEDIIESGIDINACHTPCHPPTGHYTMVSIMGLRAYVDDQEIVAALQPYGKIKEHMIRLKYKKDHELAGLENGNRMVAMILKQTQWCSKNCKLTTECISTS